MPELTTPDKLSSIIKNQKAILESITPSEVMLTPAFRDSLNSTLEGTCSFGKFNFIWNKKDGEIFIDNFALVYSVIAVPIIKVIQEYTSSVLELDLSTAKFDSKTSDETKKEVINTINNSTDFDDDDKKTLIKVITDYDSWYGKKSVDRKDCWESPLYNIFNLIAASSSYISNIAGLMSDDSNNQLYQTGKDFLELVKDSNNIDTNTETVTNTGKNILYYGAPGTGKSYLIDHDSDYANFDRITFYPDYDYSDFVGGLKPCRDSNGNITYDYIPGPLLHSLLRAYNSPNTNEGIIIEELNRANAASVFGDLFQLLDRNLDGSSQYSIRNDEIANFLDEDTYADYDFFKNGVRFPENFTIVASMNPSDQAVFTLDTAFKRRWVQQYQPIDWSKSPLQTANLAGFNIPWPKAGKIINDFLCNPRNEINVEEDSLLGQFFITESEYQDIDKVSSKLLGYLWNDVARYSRKQLFAPEINTLSELISNFTYNTVENIAKKDIHAVFVKELHDQLFE